jgi:hypothetical protein
VPIHAVLESRKYWIDFSFTPLAILLGKIAAPICLLRLLLTRRDEETYAPSLLFGAVVQYLAFKEGADVHIFWPHYFAPYFALALAQLVGAVAGVVGWVARRFAPSDSAALVAATGLALGLLPVVAMAHDGAKSLWVWRRTGGRYDDNGTLIISDVDLLFVIQEVVVPRTPRGARLDVHPSAHWYWNHEWKYQGPTNPVATPLAGSATTGTHPFWIAQGLGLTSDEEKKIAATAHVRSYGDKWVVDQREPPAPLDAYSLNEREPDPFEWLVYGGTEPVRSIGPSPDPWLTWDWRTHLGQSAPRPAGNPRTLDEMRIAHNVAIDRGDEAEAERWRERIEAQLDRSIETRFDQGVQLIGARVTGGVQPRVEAWFECTGPMGEASFNVRSTIEAREPLSLIPPDRTDREMAWPPPLPTKLWRARFLYKTDTVLNHRIGRERYWGRWNSMDGAPAPRRKDGQLETTLAVIP